MTPAETVLAFHETRSAIAAEKRLQDAGLPVRVMPRPSALGEGCGICLRVDDGERERALELLLEAGVAVQSVFAKTRRDGATVYSEL